MDKEHLKYLNECELAQYLGIPEKVAYTLIRSLHSNEEVRYLLVLDSSSEYYTSALVILGELNYYTGKWSDYQGK